MKISPKIIKIAVATLAVGGIGAGGYFAAPYLGMIPYVDKIPYVGELLKPEVEVAEDQNDEAEKEFKPIEKLELADAFARLEEEKKAEEGENPDGEETEAKAKEDKEKDAKADGETEEEIETTQRFIRTTSKYEKLPQGEYQPWRVVRRLQVLQDDIAVGRPFAQEEYAEQLQEAAGAINLLDDSIWQYERNLDAMAVFLMFGGPSELGYKALRKTRLDIPHRIFLDAALAFVERDVTRANGLMYLIDHNGLPYSMGAQLALSKSMTLSTADLRAALQYLMEARRMAPGTLVEEAALRRSIRIAGETKDFDLLKSLQSTYLSRFSKSYYFNDFVRNIGFASVRMPASQEKGVLALLNQLVDYTDVRQTASIAVYVARYAAISGRKKLAEWSEIQTEGKLRPNSKLQARMRLYSAAAKVVQPEKIKETMADLEDLNDRLLGKTDLKILNAVNLIGERILTDQEEMSAEIEARRSAPDKSNKQLMAEQEREKVIELDVQQNPAVTKASALFAEIEQLDPENAQ